MWSGNQSPVPVNVYSHRDTHGQGRKNNWGELWEKCKWLDKADKHSLCIRTYELFINRFHETVVSTSSPSSHWRRVSMIVMLVNLYLRRFCATMPRILPASKYSAGLVIKVGFAVMESVILLSRKLLYKLVYITKFTGLMRKPNLSKLFGIYSEFPFCPPLGDWTKTGRVELGVTRSVLGG